MSLTLPLNVEIEIQDITDTEVWLYKVVFKTNVDANDYSVIVTIKNDNTATQIYPCRLVSNIYSPELWVGFFVPSPYKLAVNQDERFFCKLILSNQSATHIAGSGELYYDIFEPAKGH